MDLLKIRQDIDNIISEHEEEHGHISMGHWLINKIVEYIEMLEESDKHTL